MRTPANGLPYDVLGDSTRGACVGCGSATTGLAPARSSRPEAARKTPFAPIKLIGLGLPIRLHQPRGPVCVAGSSVHARSRPCNRRQERRLPLPLGLSDGPPRGLTRSVPWSRRARPLPSSPRPRSAGQAQFPRSTTTRRRDEDCARLPDDLYAGFARGHAAAEAGGGSRRGSRCCAVVCSSNGGCAARCAAKLDPSSPGWKPSRSTARASCSYR